MKMKVHKGPFTIYVYKTRYIGSVVQKCPLFVHIHTIENLNPRGVGGQKRQNLVNVVCKRAKMLIHN